MDYLKIYDKNSLANCAFFMEEGFVVFYATTMDKYTIKGNNLVLGCTELLMKNFCGEHTLRLETLVAPAYASLKKIPEEKFIANLQSYSFLLNVSIVLAKQVLLTNKIINRNSTLLDGEKRELRDLSTKYYRAVSALNLEYEKRKLPWLNDILKKHLVSLNYKRGEAFCKSQESITVGELKFLSDKMIEYPKGSAICKESDQGDELFILQAGSLDVEVGGVKVATIDKQGTVFGEMALLLSKKRSATLRAKNNTVVLKISRQELKEICEKDNSLLKTIAISLAQKHYYNLLKVSSLTSTMVDMAMSLEEDTEDFSTPQQIYRLKADLGKLKNEISDAIYKKDADFLKPIEEILS
ncbi:MAG: cyclic nucleotide-binding domain-containing protein [Spirochaetes bacterium]|nr:cyclic nucleotide-binding domain-containing protein [Spirochaetota bacterium]